MQHHAALHLSLTVRKSTRLGLFSEYKGLIAQNVLNLNNFGITAKPYISSFIYLLIIKNNHRSQLLLILGV